MLKTFAVWFGLGVGLVTSGFVTVDVVREVRGSSSADFLLALGILVVSGGLFSGFLALAVRRIIEPGSSGSAVLRGDALLNRANQLGVSLKHIHDSNGGLLEPELQRRVLDAEKAIRERRGYVVAVTAAVIAGVSAIAAWMSHIK